MVIKCRTPTNPLHDSVGAVTPIIFLLDGDQNDILAWPRHQFAVWPSYPHHKDLGYASDTTPHSQESYGPQKARQSAAFKLWKRSPPRVPLHFGV